MTSHAPTLERLHAFEHIDGDAGSAFWAVWNLAFFTYTAWTGQTFFALYFAVSTVWFLIKFDRELDDAYCEYTRNDADP